MKQVHNIGEDFLQNNKSRYALAAGLAAMGEMAFFFLLTFIPSLYLFRAAFCI